MICGGSVYEGRKDAQHLRDRIQITTQLQNGSAVIELTLPEQWKKGGKADRFFIYLWDAEGHLAFYCNYPAREDDPCMIRLFHPHLWEGAGSPYLYHLEVYGRDEDGEECLGRMVVPVRQLTKVSDEEYLLNQRPFQPRAVLYEGVCTNNVLRRGQFWEQTEHRLRQLVQMGANMLILERASEISSEEYETLSERCDRAGLLLRIRDESVGGCPKDCISGGKLFAENHLPGPAYYLQKARWSREPFVYLCAESLRRQHDGCCQITAYSNAKRVALLINGRVFGFQNDGPEFVFQDIPAKGLPLVLTAEAGECSMSVTCYAAAR